MQRFTLLTVFGALIMLLTACPSTDGGKNDTTKPTITVTSSVTAEQASYTLTGTATDNVKVTKLEYKLGSAERSSLTLGEDSTFSKELTLVEGTNTITVYTEDAVGNKAEKTHDVILTLEDKTAQGVVEATNTIADAITSGDSTKIQAMVAKLAPAFLLDIIRNTQPSPSTKRFPSDEELAANCVAAFVTKVENTTTFNFSAPECQGVFRGLSVAASGKAVLSLTFTTNGRSWTLTTPQAVNISVTKGTESFAVNFSGGGTYAEAITRGGTQYTTDYSLNADFRYGMAANSTETGQYAYDSSAKFTASLEVLSAYNEETQEILSQATAQGNGDFSITDKLKNSTVAFDVVTSQPFIANDTCEGVFTGSASINFPASTTTYTYTDCKKYDVITN